MDVITNISLICSLGPHNGFFLTVPLYLNVLPSLKNETQSHPGMNKAMKTHREVCVCVCGER